jgi:acyl-CoA synthetase (AMP-forming)/AMP-acid ligase II
VISGSLRPRFPESISRRPRSVGEARETQSAENIAERVEKHFETGDKLKEGWAYPGDIGTIDEGGFLRLLGRTSDLIIRGGVNVHPLEVEATIAEHEGVREVAVVGFANLLEGEEIAAFVVPAGNLTEASLVAHCRARLSSDSGRANLRAA